jgi:flagellar motor switch/type III secretory pathway protein FliN
VIAALAFGPAQRLSDGREIREPFFELRSTLPLSAACVVACGVREELGRLLGREFDVELIEPQVPRADVRSLLCSEALVVRVRGRLFDAFVLIRPTDARRIVAIAFGEPERPERDVLSAIERGVVERVASACVPFCGSLCGSLGASASEPAARAEHESATYFEVRTTGEGAFAIGFALSDDPAEQIGNRIDVENLLDVRLDGRVELASGSLPLPAFANLESGTSVALQTRLGEPGRLRVGEVTIAYGTCGTSEERGAFVVTSFDRLAT